MGIVNSGVDGMAGNDGATIVGHVSGIFIVQCGDVLNCISSIQVSISKWSWERVVDAGTLFKCWLVI